MEGTHYYAPRFGRADLAKMVVHAQCEVDRSIETTIARNTMHDKSY